MPGVYRLDLPDACLATGVNSVVVMLHGATGMAPCLLEIELTGWDNQDAQRGGLTALPSTGTLAVNPVLAATVHTGATIPTVTSVTNDVGITQAGADKVWSSATRTLTAFSTTLAQSVWDVLESAITTASSIGLKVKANLDAAVSAVKAKTDQLTFTSSNVNAHVKAQDDIDFSTTQKASLNAATPASVTGSVGSVASPVTVGTNNDKTGYSLSSSGVQTIWDALTANMTTAGSVGKCIADNLDATVSSRSTYNGSDTPGTTTLLSRIIGTLTSGNHYPQSGDAYAVVTNATYGNSALHTEVAKDATVMKAADYTAPDNAGIAAIKAQTDKLAFTVANKVDANVLVLNGDAIAAANLAKSASVIYQGTVTGAATTTTLIDSGLTQSATDFWKGRVIIFTTGSLKYEATDITAFDPATHKLTFTALTSAPSTGDTYVIV